MEIYSEEDALRRPSIGSGGLADTGYLMGDVWRFECFDLFLIEWQIQGSYHIIEMFGLSRAYNWRGYFGFSQHPRKRHLRARDTAGCSHRAYRINVARSELTS